MGYSAVDIINFTHKLRNCYKTNSVSIQVSIFYNDKLSATSVNPLNVKEASLENVLSTLLKGTNITFKVEDNIIYLSENNSSQEATQQKVGQERTITGQVIDTKGEMLIGVSILQKGTSNGTITDMDGNYTLRSVENSRSWYSLT